MRYPSDSAHNLSSLEKVRPQGLFLTFACGTGPITAVSSRSRPTRKRSIFRRVSHAASATRRSAFRGRKSRSERPNSFGNGTWSSRLASRNASPCASPSARRENWESWIVFPPKYQKSPRLFLAALLYRRNALKFQEIQRIEFQFDAPEYRRLGGA